VALTTRLVIPLTSLQPGTTYHVRASSINTAGNSLSLVVPIATDSRRRSAASADEPTNPNQVPEGQLTRLLLVLRCHPLYVQKLGGTSRFYKQMKLHPKIIIV
jgi:hypothetical protein